PRGIGKHLEDVVLGPRKIGRDLEGPPLPPDPLPMLLGFLSVVTRHRAVLVLPVSDSRDDGGLIADWRLRSAGSVARGSGSHSPGRSRCWRRPLPRSTVPRHLSFGGTRWRARRRRAGRGPG